MTNETILTDEEIIAIGHQASAIEAGENGYILPIAFARAIEQAVLQSLPAQTSNTIRGDSYAGIYIWLGSANITQHISESLIENARDPQSMVECVASESVKQLGQYVLKSDELLEVLDELANGYEGNGWDVGLVKRLEKARAVIAKITGDAAMEQKND